MEGSTPGGRSFLARGGTDVYTDFPFEVQTIIKNSSHPELRVGQFVMVRRPSGTVIIGGREAVTAENDFPLFERSEHYVLFLTRQGDDSAYVVVGGPQGVFSLREGAKQLSVELGDWSKKHGAMARPAFFDEVRALLKFSSS